MNFNFETAYNQEGCNIYEIKSDIIDKNLGDKFITLDTLMTCISPSFCPTKPRNINILFKIIQA